MYQMSSGTLTLGFWKIMSPLRHRFWEFKPSPTSILGTQTLTDIDFWYPNPHRHRFLASKPSPTSILGINTIIDIDFEDVDFHSGTWECHDLILVILGIWTGDSNDLLGFWPLPPPCPLHPEYPEWRPLSCSWIWVPGHGLACWDEYWVTWVKQMSSLASAIYSIFYLPLPTSVLVQIVGVWI